VRSSDLDARARVIDRAFQSMIGGDPDWTAYDDEVVYEQHFGNTAGVYHGHGGMRRWIDAFYEVWSQARGEMSGFRQVGEQVASDFSVVVTAPQSGLEVELRGTALYEFGSDGRIVRLDTYNDPAEIEAALQGAD
jgi:ketosteroid isomerase-like protein